MTRLENAFGSVPQSFDRRIDETLDKLMRPKRSPRRTGMRPRLALLIAALLILMACAVYAAETFGLLSFFERYHPGAVQDMPVTSVYERIEAGPVALTVLEAAADGRSLYLNLLAQAEEGACMMPDAASLAGESRRMFTVSIRFVGPHTQSAEVLRAEDGSWQIVLCAPLVTEADAAAVRLECVVREYAWTARGAREQGEEIRTEAKLTLPVTAPLERWTARAEGNAAIGDTGAYFSQVRFVRTPIALYYEAQIDGELPGTVACAVVDAAGEALPIAPGAYSGLLEGSLPADTPPGGMRLRFFQSETKDTLAIIQVK